MKKYFSLIFATFLYSFVLTQNVSAIMVESPVDSYGYADAITNRWTDDTLDAQDNDVIGDVDWFVKVQGLPMNNPSEVYFGKIERFSTVTFSIGNSPLRAGERAKFDFYYGTLQNQNNVLTVVYRRLPVKDLDGGFALSNQSYRYKFAIPQDWAKMRPHVQAHGDDMYYIKMVCNTNCANGVNNGNFQINQITTEREVLFHQVPANPCVLNPFGPQCLLGARI